MKGSGAQSALYVQQHHQPGGLNWPSCRQTPHNTIYKYPETTVITAAKYCLQDSIALVPSWGEGPLGVESLIWSNGRFLHSFRNQKLLEHTRNRRVQKVWKTNRQQGKDMQHASKHTMVVRFSYRCLYLFSGLMRLSELLRRVYETVNCHILRPMSRLPCPVFNAQFRRFMLVSR